MPDQTRRLLLVGLVSIGGLVLWSRVRNADAVDVPRLTYVATAQQLGVVGYRDPVGAISPDAQRIAYAEGRFVRVRPVDGGAVAALPLAEGQVRYLTWMPGGRAILVEDGAANRRWWVYDIAARSRVPLWADRAEIGGTEASGARATARINDLRQVQWTPDGRAALAIINGREGAELWTVTADGSSARVERGLGAISAPTTAGASSSVACLVGRRLSIPCGAAPLETTPTLDLYGPIAFSPDGTTAYAGAAPTQGTLDLWQIDVHRRRASRLTTFARDSYQPTVASNGTLMFKTQTYRTQVADVSAVGGPTRGLATFQSETPSYSPTGQHLAVTFGSWRRVVDDAKYPDIAQDLGLIDLQQALPAAAPAAIVAQSDSEDQAMAWSPNGRWIVLHSHREMSDDLWIKPADGSHPDRRITALGRGAETGWPRWSPDGRWVIFNAARGGNGRSALWIAGVDQNTGAVTAEPSVIELTGVAGVVVHAEWLPDSDRLAVLMREGPGRQAIVIGRRVGGAVRVVHRLESEHDFPGLGSAPDGRTLAFVAPAPDGFFQVFRLALDGGAPTQVTTDPSNKTQPAWSPDGARIAFTVWNYEATFWAIRK